MPPGQTALFILGCIIIILGAYFTTYYIGKKSIKSLAGRSIKLKDRMSVTRDKGFYMVEAGGKVYFVAMTNHGATLLDSYPAGEMAKEQAARPPAANPANGALARGIAKGIAIIKRGVSVKNDGGLSDLERRITLQNAQEEDSLDRVVKEIQQRRETRRDSLRREDKA